MVFNPLFLEHVHREANPGDETSSATQLPLLVRHFNEGPDRNQPGNSTITLLLVDLGRLLEEVPKPQWLCFVNAEGKILWEQGRNDSDYFTGISGAKLLAMSEDLSTGQYQKGLVNRWSDPWLVATAPSTVLPVTLFSAQPAKNLRVLILRYLTLVAGMTILALFGAILGIMRVMNRVTRRMGELADSMSALAKGEYSRRLPEGRWDEIGQLIGYFNLMAISLDEAHREVKEKTVHLRTALENMRLLDKAKDDFLVLISHEVRTPLTSIMGGVDFLKSTMARASEQEQAVFEKMNVSEVVAIIQNNGERLSGFMTDAIQMTAIQSVDRRLNLKPQPVADLFEMGLCGIREKASQRNIQVENQLHDQVWAVLGDAKILKIALEKILNNALVHNREGGKILIREVWTVPGQGGPDDLLRPEDAHTLMAQPDFSRYEDEDVRWRLIEIFNSGEPIPEDRREALFGKFQLVGRIEHHQKGSGLSLPIAQGAVQCHGGRLLLHSHENDGNSFYLMLPPLLDQNAIDEAMAASLWDDARQSIGGVAGDKKVGQVADLTMLKVEVDDLGTPVDRRLDQAGGGINRTGSADHQKQVAVGSRRK